MFTIFGYTVAFRCPLGCETIGRLADFTPIMRVFWQSPITITRKTDYDPSQEIVGDGWPTGGKPQRSHDETSNFS